MNERQRLIGHVLLAIGLTLLTLLPANAQERNKPPKAFTAEYALTKNGITIAHANMSLYEQDNHWHYKTIAKPTGFAALLSNDQIEQYSLVKIENNKIIPLQYHKRNQDKINSKIVYQQSIATASYNGENVSINLNKAYYDDQSLELAINNDLRHNKPINEYNIIDELSTKTYQFENQGFETIKSFLGEIKTIKLARNRGTRQTISWHAPELDFLPIQIKQYKNQKLKSTLSLSAHTFQ